MPVDLLVPAGATAELTSPRAKELARMLREGGPISGVGIPHQNGLLVLHGPMSSYSYWMADADSDLWADGHGVTFTRRSSNQKVTVDGRTLLLDIEPQEVQPTDNADTRHCEGS